MNSCIKLLIPFTIINGALHHLKDDKNLKEAEVLITGLKNLSQFCIKEYVPLSSTKSPIARYETEAHKVVAVYNSKILTDVNWNNSTILIFVMVILNDVMERLKNKQKINSVHLLHNMVYALLLKQDGYNGKNPSSINEYDEYKTATQSVDILFNEYIK